MTVLFSAPVALLLLATAVRMWRRDNRRLRIAVIGAAGLWFALEAVFGVLTLLLPPLALLLLVPVALLPVFILVLAGALVVNGMRMLSRESRSLANALSLLAGVALVAVPVVAGLVLWLLLSIPTGPLLRGFVVAALTVVVVGAVYVSVFFVLFLGYGSVYRRAPVGATGALIVLGSGLIGGRVPPLLASRLDRALAVFAQQRAAGRACILVPSGGQGADEPRPEGEAMAEYLVAEGAPAGVVFAETASRDTAENLRFSAPIVAEHGSPGGTVLVTSDYHVLRAALLSRRVGLEASATGARTARYFAPSATLREFIAVALMYPRTQAVAVAVCVLLGLGTGALAWLAGQA